MRKVLSSIMGRVMCALAGVVSAAIVPASATGLLLQPVAAMLVRCRRPQRR